MKDIQRGLTTRGATILHFFISAALMLVLITGALNQFFSASRHSQDHEVMSSTEQSAQNVLALMVADFRMIGSGLPIGQADFSVADATLGTAPLPILTTATATNISFRMNAVGESTVLSADYTPTALDLTISVLDGSLFETGDLVYLSDMTVGGESGMQGTVASVSGNSVTFTSAYEAPAGATFPVGTLVEPVETFVFDSPGGGSGITRDDGNGPILMAPDSNFSLEYLDASLTALTPPLSASQIENSLSAIRIALQISSERKKQNGLVHTASASQLVGLRNINLNR